MVTNTTAVCGVVCAAKVHLGAGQGEGKSKEGRVPVKAGASGEYTSASMVCSVVLMWRAAGGFEAVRQRTLPRIHKPGEFFQYKTIDTAVLGWLVERAVHDTELLDEKELTRRLAALADDPVALRRYLVDAGELHRDPDGRNYRRGSSGSDPA